MRELLQIRSNLKVCRNLDFFANFYKKRNAKSEIILALEHTCAAICVVLGGGCNGGGPRVAGAGRLEVRVLGRFVRIALPRVRDAALDSVRVEQFVVDEAVTVAHATSLAAVLALGVEGAAALDALLTVLLHHDLLHILVVPAEPQFRFFRISRFFV